MGSRRREKGADKSAKQKKVDAFLKAKADPTYEWTKTAIRAVAKSPRFVITCAQNNTPLHRPLWNAINAYAKHHGAELLVIPTRYKNPTNAQEAKKALSWPSEVVQHLVDSDVPIHKKLRVMGHVRVQATAVNPLTGFYPMSQGSSCIIGHAQVAMQTVPTPQAELPVILQSTGSVSQKNYSTTRAGARGEFHHTLGFVVVEKKGKYFHLRHVCADSNGEFYDLDEHWGPDGLLRTHVRAEGLICGDSHALWHADLVRVATFADESSMCAILKPKIRVLHDVLDGYSISHHHRKNPFTQWAKHEFGLHRVEDELEATLAFIEGTTPEDCKNIIVASNHNEHFTRWLKEVRISDEPWNAQVYHLMMSKILAATRMTENQMEMPDPFALYAEGRLRSDTMFPGRDEPVTIADVLVTMHGDVGPNGRWGSRQVLADIGVRSVIGHSHSPGITRGCYQVGTSTPLSLEYTRGPSSWLNTHCIIHPNGKRQLLNIMPDGSWNGR